MNRMAQKRMAKCRDRMHESEAGLTVIELLVAIVLAGLLMTMLVGLFSTTSKTITLGSSLDDSTRVAGNAMNEINRVMRVATTLPVANQSLAATAFTFAGRESVTFYSNVNVPSYALVTATHPSQPTMVTFNVNASRQLIEYRWTASPSGDYWIFGAANTATASTTRNLSQGLLVPGTDAPLFSYFDKDGVPVLTPAIGSLSATDLAKIASMRVTVKVISTTSDTNAPVIIQNDIALPNLKQTVGAQP